MYVGDMVCLERQVSNQGVNLGCDGFGDIGAVVVAESVGKMGALRFQSCAMHWDDIAVEVAAE